MESDHNKFDHRFRHELARLFIILKPYHIAGVITDDKWKRIHALMTEINEIARDAGVDTKKLMIRLMEGYEFPDNWDDIPDDLGVSLTRKRRHARVAWGEMRRAVDNE